MYRCVLLECIGASLLCTTACMTTAHNCHKSFSVFVKLVGFKQKILLVVKAGHSDELAYSKQTFCYDYESLNKCM